MKANELRIGNFVTIDNPKHHPSIKGKPFIVLAIDEIDEPKCSLICTDPKENLIIPAYSQFLKFIQPIPLTAEWLEKFGFAEGNKRCAYLNLPGDEGESLPFFYVNSRNSVEYVQLMDSMEENEIKRIKHVHQLQNLYFALTGEELTIKEETK